MSSSWSTPHDVAASIVALPSPCLRILLKIKYEIGLVASGWLGACQLQPATKAQPATTAPRSASAVQTDRFRLSASPGCADGYPARIAEGRFITSAGGSFPVPYGHFLESAWGGSAVGCGR